MMPPSSMPGPPNTGMPPASMGMPPSSTRGPPNSIGGPPQPSMGPPSSMGGPPQPNMMPPSSMGPPAHSMGGPMPSQPSYPGMPPQQNGGPPQPGMMPPMGMPPSSMGMGPPRPGMPPVSQQPGMPPQPGYPPQPGGMGGPPGGMGGPPGGMGGPGYPGMQQPGAGRQGLNPDNMPNPIQVMKDDRAAHQGQEFCTNEKGKVPPLVTTHFLTRDQGNTGPRLMRSTMYSVPDNPDMKKQTGVPLGLVMSPLAEPAPGEYPPPVVNLGELGPVRCLRF